MNVTENKYIKIIASVAIISIIIILAYKIIMKTELFSATYGWNSAYLVRVPLQPHNITMSSQWDTNTGPEKLLDGRIDTMAHTQCSGKQTITISLPRLMTICKVILKQRPDCCNERIVGGIVFFRKSVMNPNQEKPYSYTIMSNRPIYEINTPIGTNCDQIIISTYDNCLHLAEIEVYTTKEKTIIFTDGSIIMEGLGSFPGELQFRSSVPQSAYNTNLSGNIALSNTSTMPIAQNIISSTQTLPVTPKLERTPQVELPEGSRRIFADAINSGNIKCYVLDSDKQSQRNTYYCIGGYMK